MSEARTLLYECSRCGQLSQQEPTEVIVKEWQTASTGSGPFGVWNPTPQRLCDRCLRSAEPVR